MLQCGDTGQAFRDGWIKDRESWHRDEDEYRLCKDLGPSALTEFFGERPVLGLSPMQEVSAETMAAFGLEYAPIVEQISDLKERDKIEILGSSPAWITSAGRCVKVVKMAKSPPKPLVHLAGKDENGILWFVNESTGEAFKMSSVNRSESVESFYKTLERLRMIINTNCLFPENVKFVTLTIRDEFVNRDENGVQFTKDAYKMYKDFWLRFRRYNDRNGEQTPEYITVLEPQGRGVWHFHSIFIYDDTAPFIENKVLADIWGKGFVSVKNVSKDCDNIGAYFSAYLADIPIDDLSEQELKRLPSGNILEKSFVENGKTVTKRILKGGRIWMYPSFTKLYRVSRGIKRPAVEKTTAGKSDNLTKHLEMSYQRDLVIRDDGKTVNLVSKAYYKA